MTVAPTRPGHPRPPSTRTAVGAAAASALLLAACAEPGPGVPADPVMPPASAGTGAEREAAERGHVAVVSAKDGTCEARDGDCAMPPDVARDPGARNVLGGSLEVCSQAPLTGWRRSGRCETGPRDRGVHVVCARVTEAFLDYSRERGNDLVTPRPEHRFPGLQAGDRWCLCAARWLEAVDGGVAPPVVLDATEDTALRFMSLDTLRRRSVDDSPTP